MLDRNSESQTQLDGPPLLPDSPFPILLLCLLALPPGFGQLGNHRIRAVDPNQTCHGPSVDDDLAP